MASEQPAKLGMIGTSIAVVIGASVYHWWTNGADIAQAMRATPTSGSAGLGALIGGLCALAAPQLPVVGSAVSGVGGFVGSLIGRIKTAIGLGGKLIDQIPSQLIDDVTRILMTSGGVVTLDDIQKLIVDFSQVHPVAIFDVIRQIVATLRNGPTTSGTEEVLSEASKVIEVKI